MRRQAVGWAAREVGDDRAGRVHGAHRSRPGKDDGPPSFPKALSQGRACDGNHDGGGEEQYCGAGSARQLLALQSEPRSGSSCGRGRRALLLAAAALVYAPSLTPGLNRANVLVLVPSLLWTIAQYVLFYRRERLPGWLAIVNPLVDVAGVTAIMAAYALEQSATLALKSPIFLAYFAILAARRSRRPLSRPPRSPR